jgi:hypothetical protein
MNTWYRFPAENVTVTPTELNIIHTKALPFFGEVSESTLYFKSY